MNKSALLKESAETMARPKVMKWYTKHLANKNQGDIINDLLKGIKDGQMLEEDSITIYEALCIALVCGIQWNIKFEGTP